MNSIFFSLEKAKKLHIKKCKLYSIWFIFHAAAKTITRFWKSQWMHPVKKLWKLIGNWRGSCIQVFTLKWEIKIKNSVFNFWTYIFLFFLDKNHAPQANEAMTRVTKAHEILTNSTERTRYDQTVMSAKIPHQPNENDDDDEVFNMNRNDHFPEYHNWWATRVRNSWFGFSLQ